MPGINYAASHLAVLDEEFNLPSKTSEIVNKGDVKLNFEGRNAVTIYSVDDVAEVDYVSHGVNRFGTMNEISTSTQTFTLSQDKGATWSIDRRTNEDQMNLLDANESIARQVRNVAVPATDIYRLAVLHAYAVANSQVTTNGLSTADAFEDFLVQTALLTDALVPEEGRVVYMTETTYNMLRLSTTFTKACDDSYKNLQTGVRTMVNGVKVIVVPTSYLPANTGFLFTHEKTMVSPTKFQMARVLTEVQGIDGSVCEYRRYYDAFIPSKKGVSVRAHMTA